MLSSCCCPPGAGGVKDGVVVGKGDVGEGSKVATEGVVALGVPTAQVIAESQQASVVRFGLNGELREVADPDPTMSLATYLRAVEGLTGTKVSCNEGGCGACTVDMATSDASGNWTHHAINACLRPVCSLDGAKITTIEGIAKDDGTPHPIAKKLAEYNGSQCGFCSTGFVMNMYSMLESTDGPPTHEDIERRFDGNICRCTGYRPILDAMHSFAGDADHDACIHNKEGNACAHANRNGTCAHAHANGACGDIEDLCAVQSDLDRKLRACGPRAKRFGGKRSGSAAENGTNRANGASGDGVTWVSPTSLSALCAVLSDPTRPKATQMVCGNTGIKGVAPYYNGAAWGGASAAGPQPDLLVDISKVPELSGVTTTETGITVGATTTLATFIGALAAFPKNRIFSALTAHMQTVANVQVRGVGTLGGNLALAASFPTFPSDLHTILSAAGATVTLVDPCDNAKAETVAIASLSLDGKILQNIHVPFSPGGGKEGEEGEGEGIFRTFKVRPRHQNAHAYVNAAFWIGQSSGNGGRGGGRGDGGEGDVVTAARLFYGGVMTTGLVRASKTEGVLVGASFSDPQVQARALECLSKEITPDGEDSTSIDFKSKVVANLLYGLFTNVPSWSERPLSTGKWTFPKGTPALYPVSEAVQKISALDQCTGATGVYTDDLGIAQQEVHGAFVTSTSAKASKYAIQAPPGVVLLDAAALARHGIGTAVNANEDLFATPSTGVQYVGQRLALVLAPTHDEAVSAAGSVRVTYEGIDPKPLLTIADAMDATPPSVFNDKPATFTKGGDASAVAAALAASPVRVSGTCDIGHQHHYFMEPHVALANVTETKIQVHLPTQAPGFTAKAIASNLGVPHSRVEVSQKQAGGGFGGKASRAVPCALAAAAASKILKRPVRIRMEMRTVFTMMGSRKPHHFEYEAGANRDGTVNAVVGTLWYQQGAFLDAGDLGGLNYIQISIDGAYNIPHWDLKGYTCRTNTPVNTACRGPVFFPGQFIINQVMDRLASELGLTSESVKYKNLYKDGDVFNSGDTVVDCNLLPCWSLASSTLAAEENAIAAFNKSSRFVKRGVSLTPMKYFVGPEQGNPSYVSVNADGTVLIMHGGSEIGQGLNTKVCQMAAEALGIDMSLITIGETTSRVSAMAGTGGSSTSGAVCASTQLACLAIKQNMMAGVPNNGSIKWEDWVSQCMDAQVELHAYKTYVGKATGKDLPAAGSEGYTSWGAAMISVEVNVLTGALQILTCKIVQDAGVSLNPAIDCGQAQGAMVMGLGAMLTEEFTWDAEGTYTGGVKGANVASGTWEYKPFASLDIPQDFDITLLPNAANPAGVCSAKSVGEPPLLLSVGVISSIRKAIEAFRSQFNANGFVAIRAPMTVRQIIAAAMDGLDPKDVLSLEEGSD